MTPNAAVAGEASPGAPSALLATLAFANLAVGVGAFVVVGVLGPIADALAVSEAQAGLAMSLYALVYGVASPLMVARLGGVDRADLLAAAMVVFGLGALACALAPSLPWLLLGRSVMALGAALVTPVASAVALAVSTPAERGRALARVFGGLALAQAVGVPLGAWIGYAVGWRASLAVVVALAALATIALRRATPRGIATGATSLAALGAALRTPRQLIAVSATAFFIGGLWVFFTYLGPFLEARHGLGRDGVTLALALYGAGAVAGNAIGGRLADRIGPQATLSLLCLAQVALLPALTLAPTPLWATLALLMLWSACGWSFVAPQQARLAAIAPAAAPVLFALNASAIYLGSAIGAALGGLALGSGAGEARFAANGPIGALCVLVALAALVAAPAPRPDKARL